MLITWGWTAEIKICKREKRNRDEELGLAVHYKYFIFPLFTVIQIAFWISIHVPSPYSLIYQWFLTDLLFLLLNICPFGQINLALPPFACDMPNSEHLKLKTSVLIQGEMCLNTFCGCSWWLCKVSRVKSDDRWSLWVLHTSIQTWHSPSHFTSYISFCRAFKIA